MTKEKENGWYPANSNRDALAAVPAATNPWSVSWKAAEAQAKVDAEKEADPGWYRGKRGWHFSGVAFPKGWLDPANRRYVARNAERAAEREVQVHAVREALVENRGKARQKAMADFARLDRSQLDQNSQWQYWMGINDTYFLPPPAGFTGYVDEWARMERKLEKAKQGTARRLAELDRRNTEIIELNPVVSEVSQAESTEGMLPLEAAALEAVEAQRRAEAEEAQISA